MLSGLSLGDFRSWLAHNAGENRRAKRLQEQICTQPVQGAAHDGAGARADKYQYGSPDVLDAEDHR